MYCTETNFYQEILKSSSPIIVVFLAFWFNLKTKKKDIDNDKIKELNTVLANMLNSWHNLNRLSELLQCTEDKSDDLLFPLEYLPFVALKTGLLDDNSFSELEKSIKSLKKYDSITYHELEGIGRKFNYIRTNYIIPFLQFSKGQNSNIQIISRTFLDKLLNDIEEHLRKTSKLISKSTYLKIEKKIENNFTNDFKKFKEELNLDYYDLIISIVPEDKKHLTFEELKNEFKKPEIQRRIHLEYEFIMKKGIDKLVSLISQNPTMTIEELEEKLNEE